MGPIVLMFGLDPRLSAVSTSLRRMRGTDGDIQGSVGVAQGRGEDVCGPQVRARDETWNLHFSSVITLPRCCMQEGRDGVVSPCGLPNGRSRRRALHPYPECPSCRRRKSWVPRGQRNPSENGPNRCTRRLPESNRGEG